MSGRPIWKPCLGASLVGWSWCLAVLAGADPALARVLVAPWSGNFALASSRSVAGGVVDQQSVSPPGPAAYSGTALSSAENDTTNTSAFATLNLATSFADSIFAVISSGFGFVDGVGASNRGGALVFVQFVVERTQSYVGYPVFGPGNFGSSHTLAFIANSQAGDLALVTLLPGETSSGRLAPGTYFYYYENYYRDETDNGSPNSASSQVAFFEIPDPFVDQHPTGQTVPAGANASFSIAASGGSGVASRAPQALTYQWRRNYANLANGGRISGATTNQIHIASVAVTDTGLYDCVVTEGPIVEPSSAARLVVTGGTTDAGAPRRVGGLALSAPRPNPFGRTTRLSFSLPLPADVSLDVFDLGGRHVRSLLRNERRPAGAHAIEWDGRDASGESTSSGAYFVRLRAGGETRTQRVLRLER